MAPNPTTSPLLSYECTAMTEMDGEVKGKKGNVGGGRKSRGG
eukprot:CAMPEP_0118634556 /NCGR_PEP_ID=MMETSP0785-20121206/1610_1 /TAXON_ID=91992 /ORGANISM="Bolidomonas pacifica, Strain CCMP 1866" /LENGTH=41 /DNA_ID= /DNA_START= /DNA_END= /DNA_ORIENTATION=